MIYLMRNNKNANIHLINLESDRFSHKSKIGHLNQIHQANEKKFKSNIRWIVKMNYHANIIDFQKIAENPSLAKDLAQRTSLWQTLNYIRVAVFLAISCALIPLCIKLFSLRA